MRRLTLLFSMLLALLATACGHSNRPAGFSVTTDPGTIRLLPGLGRTIPFVLKADPGFRGHVRLSVPDPGADLTASFQPTEVDLVDTAEVQVQLHLTAAETAAAGARALLVQGDAEGVSATATLALDIPSATFFTVITYRGTDPANFTWLAYQDGDGAWTAVPGSHGMYRLPVTDPQGRFGVLLGDVCTGTAGSTWITNGFFSTVGEVQSLQALVFCNPQPGPPPVTFDLRGGLAGADGGTVLISANTGLWSFPPGSASYAMKLIQGAGDLVAAAYPSTSDYVPTRFVVERGRDAQAPATRDFDFATQGNAAPSPLPIQRPALEPDESLLGTVQYQTTRGQSAILGYGPDLARYAPFPSAAALPGDTYVYAFQANGTNRSRILQASAGVPPGPLAPALPANMAPFDLTSSGGAQPRIGLAWTAVSPAPSVHEASIIQQVGSKQAYCYLYFGRSWHGGATRMAWTQPDLSAVPGFDPGFLPQTGIPVRVQIYQSGSRSTQLTLAQPDRAGIALAVPPGAGPLQAGAAPLASMRLVPVGPVPAASSWLEYWSVSRLQTLVP